MTAQRPSALVPVADGVEDIEAVTVVDVLRRADVDVTVASIGDALRVTCARGCRLTADAMFRDVEASTFDLIACPGGTEGARAQAAHEPLVEKLRDQLASGRWTAAICAAPALVLAGNGLIDGRLATCYPAFRDRLPSPSDERVVVDGKLVTSQSPATAIAFALKLVAVLTSEAEAERIGAAMLAA